MINMSGKTSVFTIGELAKKAAVNIQTIRFYERQGILKPVERLESGYRKYDGDSLKRLHFILQAKELGFSLREIQDLLNLRVRSIQACDRVRAKAEQKLEGIKLKIVQLRNLEKTLKELISDCEQRQISDCCPILERMEF